MEATTNVFGRAIARFLQTKTMGDLLNWDDDAVLRVFWPNFVGLFCTHNEFGLFLLLSQRYDNVCISQRFFFKEKFRSQP